MDTSMELPKPEPPSTTARAKQQDSPDPDPNVESSQIQVPRSRGTTPQSSQVNRLKFASPASAPASSLTPPPSTQAHNHIQSIARTPSPLPSLASPPPTNRDVAPSSAPPINDIPEQHQIAAASVDDLRSILSSLCISLRESRTTSAHYKLQYNMLVIDSNKGKNEMMVELAMLQRELDVLHQADDRRRIASTPRQSIEASNLATIQDLHRQTDLLQSEIDELRTLLTSERRAVEQRDVRIASLEEQNACLRQRIRQNREHMNGILDNVFDRSPVSAMNTPSRYSAYGTPRRPPVSTPSRQTERRDNLAFDALLLADKVLSQETATAPSTPKNPGRQARSGHVRNTHSLSSLPSTPNRRTQPTSQSLRTPLHLSAILEPSEPLVPAPVPHFPIAHPSTRRRRRASSDSTITASSADEAEPPTKTGASQSRIREDVFDDEIPESSASQAASSMLRSTPTKPRKTQSKIIGKVSKPAISSFASTVSTDYPVSPEKRRIASGIPGAEVERRGMTDASPKKRRVEHVGLGIGI